MTASGPPERSIGTLLTDLTGNLTGIIKDEIELAKLELSHKLSTFVTGLASLVAGGAVLYAGFLVLLAALCVGLGEFLAQWNVGPWVSPLIVGLVVVVIGFVLVQKGRANLAGNDLMPSRTIHSLTADVSHEKASLSRNTNGAHS